MERALPLRDSLGVRFHLSRCVACRTYMKQLQKTVALLRGRHLGEPPAEMTERVVREATTRAGTGKSES